MNIRNPSARRVVLGLAAAPLLLIGAAASPAATAGTASAPAAAAEGPGYGPGSGYGPGHGYGMGPGMMGGYRGGYGPADGGVGQPGSAPHPWGPGAGWRRGAQGWGGGYGPGMMGGWGGGYGPGMMGGWGGGYGPGMMGGWGGGYGPGMMGGWGGGYGPGMMGGWHGGYGPGPWMAGGRGAWAAQAPLSAAQARKLEAIEKALFDKQWPLMRAMHQTMIDSWGTQAAARPSVDAIMKQAKAMSDLRLQMLRNRLEAQQQIDAVLQASATAPAGARR